VEFLSLGPLEPAQQAMVDEQFSALADKLSNALTNVERAEFVTPDRFDRKLSDGLRLSSPK
jgi:hypothetical protein